MVIAVSNRVFKARRSGRKGARRGERFFSPTSPAGLAGFLSVRGLEVVAIDDGAFDHRQVGRVVLEL